MNIDKWIEENSYQQPHSFMAPKVINIDDLCELLKTHAIIPRKLSDDLCKNVNKQSCSYISDMEVKTILKFIFTEVESE